MSLSLSLCLSRSLALFGLNQLVHRRCRASVLSLTIDNYQSYRLFAPPVGAHDAMIPTTATTTMTITRRAAETTTAAAAGAAATAAASTSTSTYVSTPPAAAAPAASSTHRNTWTLTTLNPKP